MTRKTIFEWAELFQYEIQSGASQSNIIQMLEDYKKEQSERLVCNHNLIEIRSIGMGHIIVCKNCGEHLNSCEVGSNEIELTELKELYNRKRLQKIVLEKELYEANKLLIDNGLRPNPIKINNIGS